MGMVSKEAKENKQANKNKINNKIKQKAEKKLQTLQNRELADNCLVTHPKVDYRLAGSRFILVEQLGRMTMEM